MKLNKSPYLKLTALVTCFLVSSLHSITYAGDILVGPGFTYQGQLEFQGQPANGTFDFLIYLIDEDTFATSNNTIDENFINNVSVSQGVFTLQLNFDEMAFNGSAYWLDVRVKVAGGLSYTVLRPVQKLNSVPYATLSQFSLDSSSNTLFEENGNGIGYTTGKLEIGGLPLSTNSNLQVDAETGESPFRARIDGITKMRVHDNGGTSLGINDNTVADNGLLVEGDTLLKGDVAQKLDKNGLVKAGMVVTCTNNSSINRFFNNVNDQDIVIDGSIAQSNGSCAMTVPFSLNNRFFQVMVERQNDTRIGSCSNPNDNTLICVASNSSGTLINSLIHILIY